MQFLQNIRWPWQKNSVLPSLVRQDPIGNWSWIRSESFGSPTERGQPGTINWFVPPIGRGSGGHLNIFRFIRNLEASGFECRIIVCNDYRPQVDGQAEKKIAEWFFALKARVYFHPQQEVPPASISVATGWQTAYPVKAFRATRHRCYFVQDYEPWFYSAGSEAQFAEETYRFGFVGITAGDWLATKLRREFGMTAHAVGFSYDRELYRPNPKRDEIPRVLFYARPPTARRGFELGLIALAELAKRHPEIGICLAGWNLGNYKIPFPALSAGLLPLEELADLYSQCDAALVLSLTNASLLPLELMACGCLVVSNRGPNVEWLLNDDAAILVDPRIDSLVEGLEKAVYDVALRKRLVKNALTKVSETSWLKEAEKMAELFRALDN
jgi:glycosyltransferase involved in cell wall biosynthesis